MREAAIAEAERMNAVEGNMVGYDCPKCKNKGYIAGVKGLYMVMAPCECMNIRANMARLERSGLKDSVAEYTFKNYKADKPWQKGILEKAVEFAKDPKGWFYIGGQVGSGKTHICTAIASHLIKKGRERLTKTACAIQARYNKGVSNRHGEVSGVAIPVLTPDRADKRQNGRRMKENGEDMFTLTGQDRHGVAVVDETPKVSGIYTGVPKEFLRQPLPEMSRSLKANKHDAGIIDGIKIRKLTPRECFRLQGWEDKYFDRAAIVNSDSQLYRQAGNGVTVPVIYEIAKRMEKELEKATEGLR